MALASLLFKNNKATQYITSGSKDAFLVVDAVIKENHEFGATVSDKELEDGSKASDHLATSPPRVTIVGLISENPLDLNSAIVGASLGLATGLGAVAKSTFGTAALGVVGGAILSEINGNRVQNAVQILEDMQKKRILFDFVTGMRSYKNMLLEGVNIEKNQDLGQDAQFTATMKQVIIVNSQLVSFTESTTNGVPGAASGVDTGKQATKAASESTSGNGSFLFEAFPKVGVSS